MIDLDKIGPDWDFAINHGMACSPGIPINKINSFTSIESEQKLSSKHHNLCECCLNVINKQPVPLCDNSKELQFLGFGFPLYFIYTKYAIILLVLQIVTYSSLSICWALNHSVDICDEGHVRELPNHHEGVCTTWMIRFMRTQQFVTNEQIILRFTSFIIQLLGLIYMRDTIRKTNDYYDERTTSLSDYSLVIHHIPKQEGIQQKITQFMETAFDNDKFKPEELLLLNQLEQFYNYREEKRHLIKEKQKWLKKEQNQEQKAKLKELDRNIEEMAIKMEQQHNKEIELINDDKVICEKAVIIMSTEDIKDSFIQQFEELDKQILIKYFGQDAEKIEIEEAPQPKEIIWENINYPNKKRTLRLIIGWSLTALFLAIITVIFYFILQAKGLAIEQALKEIKLNPADPHAHSLQSQALAATLLTMLSIILFNKFVLSFILHLFTDIQKHRTSSQYQFSFGLKYTLGLFFTTAVMTFLVQNIRFHNIYSQEYGVVQQESIMFFFNSFLVPIIWLINPWHLFHLIKRKYYFGSKDLTQKQANDLMQDSKYSMGKKYAEIVESVWFTYLYSSLVPGGAILICLGLCFYYWVDKMTLLRRSSINENVSGKLSLQAMKLMDLTLIFRAAGEIIFDSQIRSAICFESIVCICIGGVYMLLPMNQILDFFHQQKFRSQQKPFQQIKSQLVETYRNMHPIFSKERLQLMKGIEMTTQIFGFATTKKKDIGSNQILNETTEELFYIKPVKEKDIGSNQIHHERTEEEIFYVRPAKQPIEQPAKQAIEQPAKQPIEQPSKQAIEQPTKQAHMQPFDYLN